MFRLQGLEQQQNIALMQYDVSGLVESIGSSMCRPELHYWKKMDY